MVIGHVNFKETIEGRYRKKKFLDMEIKAFLGHNKP
jgi:hypothetical protein